jgi:hypothetical protein
MPVELLPLKQEQHVVTFVPKTTTDLPFFNLTYRRKDTPSKIKFEGVDGAGNPINWEVRHNTDDDIGYAGVQAHEIWYLLIKPAIDANRLENGKVKKIIPLGGLRECLRMVGWTEGGHQAKDLIRSLTQISFAGVIADLWFPTGETDEAGKPTFRQVKGRFSRLSLYAIGEQHFTEEELKQMDFSFELEDVVYIVLDPLEMMIQEAQADSQKLIDNQYMFSVKPVARRWYELLTGKVFGTLKHKKDFFEIRYSWYIKHHHNLKKFITRKAITRQMNQVVKDHLDSGFLTKVEYRKIKEPEQEPDFIIRYYVGQTAQDSINRTKGYILNRDRKQHIEVKRANKTPHIGLNSPNEPDIPTGQKNAATTPNFESESISESREDTVSLDTVNAEHRNILQTLVVEHQISFEKAYQLATGNPDECRKQITALPFREVEMKNKAGFLIKAIENSYSLPEAYFESQKNEEQEKAWQLKQQKIADCRMCDEVGYRNVKSDRDVHSGVMHQCTHDTEIEKQFEDHRL